MHIPDGFLDAKTALATGLLSAASLGVALRQVRQNLPSRRVPLMGLTASLLFAAQMLNFPVLAGTSGHLMGSVLAGVLLGPAAAMVVISAVLIVQCFLFADGGVLALGANIFNIAMVGTFIGYAVYRGISALGRSPRWRMAAAALAAWFSLVAAAAACAGELAWSGTVAWNAVFPAMAGVHLVIGIGEALITVLVLGAILRLRPALVPAFHDSSRISPTAADWGSALLVTLGVALFISPFASPWPDGLERVAASLGFDRKALETAGESFVLADYRFPGLKSDYLSTGLAGIVGAGLVFLLGYVLARLLKVGARSE